MTQAASPDVFLSTTKKAPEAKPWKGKRSSGYFVAKTDRKKCKCRCCGEHHGKNQPHKLREKGLDEFQMV